MLAGGGAFVLIVAAAQFALPGVNEVPEHFSATVLWQATLLGLVAVGISRGTALMLALLSFGAIFLFVRTRGEEL